MGLIIEAQQTAQRLFAALTEQILAARKRAEERQRKAATPAPGKPAQAGGAPPADGRPRVQRPRAGAGGVRGYQPPRPAAQRGGFPVAVAWVKEQDRTLTLFTGSGNASQEYQREPPNGFGNETIDETTNYTEVEDAIAADPPSNDPGDPPTYLLGLRTGAVSKRARTFTSSGRVPTFVDFAMPAGGKTLIYCVFLRRFSTASSTVQVNKPSFGTVTDLVYNTGASRWDVVSTIAPSPGPDSGGSRSDSWETLGSAWVIDGRTIRAISMPRTLIDCVDRLYPKEVIGPLLIFPGGQADSYQELDSVGWNISRPESLSLSQEANWNSVNIRGNFSPSIFSVLRNESPPDLSGDFYTELPSPNVILGECSPPGTCTTERIGYGFTRPGGEFKRNRDGDTTSTLAADPDARPIGAWDWGKPGYCRDQLLALGFSAADLTP